MTTTGMQLAAMRIIIITWYRPGSPKCERNRSTVGIPKKQNKQKIKTKTKISIQYIKGCRILPEDRLMTVEWFLLHLGDPGWYKVIVKILMAANCIPVVVNYILMAFYVPF